QLHPGAERDLPQMRHLRQHERLQLSATGADPTSRSASRIEAEIRGAATTAPPFLPSPRYGAWTCGPNEPRLLPPTGDVAGPAAAYIVRQHARTISANNSAAAIAGTVP